MEREGNPGVGFTSRPTSPTPPLEFTLLRLWETPRPSTEEPTLTEVRPHVQEVPYLRRTSDPSCTSETMERRAERLSYSTTPHPCPLSTRQNGRSGRNLVLSFRFCVHLRCWRYPTAPRTPGRTPRNTDLNGGYFECLYPLKGGLGMTSAVGRPYWRQ